MAKLFGINGRPTAQAPDFDFDADGDGVLSASEMQDTTTRIETQSAQLRGALAAAHGALGGAVTVASSPAWMRRFEETIRSDYLGEQEQQLDLQLLIPGFSPTDELQLDIDVTPENVERVIAAIRQVAGDVQAARADSSNLGDISAQLERVFVESLQQSLGAGR